MLMILNIYYILKLSIYRMEIFMLFCILVYIDIDRYSGNRFKIFRQNQFMQQINAEYIREY